LPFCAKQTKACRRLELGQHPQRVSAGYLAGRTSLSEHRLAPLPPSVGRVWKAGDGLPNRSDLCQRMIGGAAVVRATINVGLRHAVNREDVAACRIFFTKLAEALSAATLARALGR